MAAVRHYVRFTDHLVFLSLDSLRFLRNFDFWTFDISCFGLSNSRPCEFSITVIDQRRKKHHDALLHESGSRLESDSNPYPSGLGLGLGLTGLVLITVLKVNENIFSLSGEIRT